MLQLQAAVTSKISLKVILCKDYFKILCEFITAHSPCMFNMLLIFLNYNITILKIKKYTAFNYYNNA